MVGSPAHKHSSRRHSGYWGGSPGLRVPGVESPLRSPLAASAATAVVSAASKVRRQESLGVGEDLRGAVGVIVMHSDCHVMSCTAAATRPLIGFWRGKALNGDRISLAGPELVGEGSLCQLRRRGLP
jgi:hypothetical protein